MKIFLFSIGYLLMPYRRTVRRTNRRRVRRFARREPTWGEVASKAYRTALYVKGLVNSELNYSEATNTTSPSDTGLLVLLNSLAEGDDVGGRTGRQIRMKSLEMRHQYTANSTAIYSRVRCIIFVDKQPSGTAPAATDLLDTSVFPLITAMRNRANTRRFKVLMDKSWQLVYGTASAIKETHHYIKMNIPVVFKGTSTGISNISSNALYCLLISNQPTNTPGVQTNFRISYRDN